MTTFTPDHSQPAFPGPVDERQHQGLTQRDYFMAHCPITFEDAQRALHPNGNHRRDLSDRVCRTMVMITWARLRKEYADAMVGVIEGSL